MFVSKCIGLKIALLAILVFIIALLPPSTLAQEDSLYTNLPEPQLVVPISGINQIATWKYHSGDNVEWADPLVDDSDWISFDPFEIGRVDPAGGWTGIGWFRLHLNIDSVLWNQPIAMIFRQMGASEIYLDGNLLFKFGKVSANPDLEVRQGRWVKPPLPINFDYGHHHIIAVRYSNHSLQMARQFYRLTDGFVIEFGDFIPTNDLVAKTVQFATAYQMFFVGLPLAFCLLHLLIFLYYPRSKQHFYFAVFSMFMAALTYFAFRSYHISDVYTYITNFWLFKITVVGISVTGLIFLYSLFYPKTPIQLWIFLILGIVIAAISKNLTHALAYLFGAVVLIEQLRAVVVAIRKKSDGVWIIGIGYLLLAIGCGYQMATDLELIPMLLNIPFPYIWGFVGMLIAMSVFLARQFARTNLNLERQILQVKKLSESAIEQERRAKEQEITRLRLEEENKRKETELEEARKRQKVMDELEITNQQLEQAYSDLKDTQSQLVQSEKMASLGTLVAGVAHEINTPVGAISSMHNTLIRAIEKLKTHHDEICEKIPEFHGETEKLYKIITDSNRVISSGAERVTNIVRRLRSFARLDEAELKQVDIHEGIEDTLTIVHHELKHKAEVERDFGDIPEIACFPSQLNQVFLNILINGVQAIKDKGKITISTFLKDQKVHIKFTDTGVGIPKESLKKVFDPGFTTKGVGVGTGLGLSICYQIVKDHRGEINVESEVGKGTSFTIIIPTNLDDILNGSEKNDDTGN